MIEKIRKILALAENNSSLEEAETAALFVQRLLLQHGLSMAEVRGGDSGGTVVGEARPENVGYRRIPWWTRDLAAIIGRNFRCTTVVRHDRDGYRSVAFIGLHDDVAVACLAYNRIKEAYNLSLRCFVRDSGPLNTGEKNDYTDGFLSGLDRKFTEQVEQYALVLTQDVRVRDHVEKMNPKKGRTSSISTAYSREAWETGHRDGRAAGGRETPKQLA